jgi:hypothetical protein
MTHWKCCSPTEGSMTYSSSTSTKEKREGREKRQGAFDRPLALSRGLGAALASWPRSWMYTPHKIPWKHILSSQGLGGYTWWVRSRAPLGEERHQDKLSLKPGKEHNQRTASKGVYLLLHRLGGYTRRVCSRAPPGKKQPNKQAEAPATIWLKT